MSIYRLIIIFSTVLVGEGIYAQSGKAAQIYMEYARDFSGSEIMSTLREINKDTVVTKYYQALIPVSDKELWTNKVVYRTKKSSDKFVVQRLVYSKELDGSENRTNVSSKSVYTNGYNKNSLFTIQTSTYLENGWMSYYEIGNSKSVLSCYDASGKVISKNSGCLDTGEDLFESIDLAQSVAFLLRLTEQRIERQISFKKNTPLVMILTINPTTQKKSLFFSDLKAYGVSDTDVQLIHTAFKSLFFQLDPNLFTFPKYLNGKNAVLRYPIPVDFSAT
ncbi:hypothetical protein [Myroides pelagicus]|uniref:Uncharacterized protein n=1 Tax=Myroides pelagicus TaxID=270914 RepID=A0A7K1GP42_9FLAO|nr:hypothetical protein [Myroides pelagicus]MEC4113836.1 hypothetical protein [Myroides pelagicus]MTH30665.1 hypothetical protein [Myroides pelagicus]